MKVKVGSRMVPLPRIFLKAALRMEATRFEKSFAFMTAAHHRVRNLAVAEMTARPRALSPAYLAQETALPEAEVRRLLDELEANKSILYRGGGEEVVYAYPSTVEPTAQEVVFDKDRRVFAA